MTIGTFDIETNGFLDVLDRVHCCCVKNHTTGDIVSFTPDNISDLCSHLDTYSILIGHNCVGFDFPALRKVFGWEYKGQVVDTVLMSRSQDLNRRNPPGYKGKAPHSVEAWGYRLGGEMKVEHEDWENYSDAMLTRCKGDVELQYNIHKYLVAEGKGRNWAPAHKLNVKIFEHLQQQEAYGFTVDVPHLDASIHTLTRWVDRVGRVLMDRLPFTVDILETKKEGILNYVKAPFNKDGTKSANVLRYCEANGISVEDISGVFSRVRSRRISLDNVAEVKDYLLSQGWRPADWNEKDGKRTSAKLTKDDPFDGVQGSIGRLVAKRIVCRQRRSVLEGWRDNIRPDGRIPTRVGGIATTGRLRHKLIVNIPSPHSKSFFGKQMRQCFIPQEGWVMVGCDSKGNQMRQLAGRMGDDEFTEAVLHGNSAEGTDLHSLNQRRSGAATRNQAKGFFYGSILFGAGDKKTGDLLNVSKEQARRIKESYMDEMPKLKALLAALSKEWRVTAKKRWNAQWNKLEYFNGYIAGIDGRPILVPYEKDLLCYALQSDEAIQMGAAYIMVHKWAKERGWVIGRDWGMLIWMHDEFQMECKPELAEELGIMSCKAIQWAGKFFNIQCEHDGDYIIGRSWYETH